MPPQPTAGPSKTQRDGCGGTACAVFGPLGYDSGASPGSSPRAPARPSSSANSAPLSVSTARSAGGAGSRPCASAPCWSSRRSRPSPSGRLSSATAPARPPSALLSARARGRGAGRSGWSRASSPPNTVMDSLIAATRATSKTLVVVTHDMEMAAKCDRTLSLSHEGRM